MNPLVALTPEFDTSPALENVPGIRHGFFTRRGGTSGGPFESLNCSPNAGDSPENVQENRRRVVQALGGHCLVTNRQVHGRRVRVVDGDTDAEALEEADGLVTVDRGICIGALGADCAPVLFAAPGVVGAAHVGWKGALAGITDTVIEAMEAFTDRRRIVAAIGPAIQPLSYEVGEEFRDRLLAMSTMDAEDCFLSHPDTRRVHFDLPAYTERRLRHAGIREVERTASDTYMDEKRFFSYRRSCHRGVPQYGRQPGAICLSRSD